MAIIVNTNIPSLNAQRQLNVTNRSLNKALERLASGLRINRAGDDAAGLAIANGLRTQVRGLGQAVRNAGDGLSVVASAEGAVSQQNEILQRIRELSVQAANGINSGANLAQIQSEISDQISELTRIGDTVEFNGKKLIDGTFQNINIQVGAQAGQGISVSIGDFRAAGLGQTATLSGTIQIDTTTAIVAAAGTANSVTVNGVQVGSSANLDTLSAFNADGSAIAKAAAISAVSAQSGVSATATAAVRTAGAIAGNATFAGVVSINGTVVIDGSSNTFAGSTDDSNGAIRNAINAKSTQTGVVATLDSANDLVLTAADGRNINLTVTGATATGLGLGGIATDTVTSGGITLTGTKDISLQIGTANADASNLGFAITAFTYTAALDPNSAVQNIDVTASGGATSAIITIDAALNSVADAQGQLGALTNRLENTINNLEISIENLSASESRIRDADFAAETANLTRAQILQQSTIAILSQANLAPQAALSLLG